MRNASKSASVFAVTALCLVMPACTTSQLVASLNVIASAAAVAVPALLASGAVPVDAASKAAILNYLYAVNTAVIQTGTELKSSDSGAVKAAKITQYFAQAALPILPAGTPPAVAQALSLVAAAIDSLLANLASGAVGSATSRSLPTRLSAQEQHILSHAMSTAAASLATLADAKK